MSTTPAAPTVVAIQIAPPDAERQQVESATAIADYGLEGDRCAGGEPEDQVTLISAEAVIAFNDETMNAFQPTDLGRNIVTQDIDLTTLIGKQFQIGSATFEGIEECKPCATLGARLAHYRLTSGEVVRGFKDSGGLRARVVSSGTIAVTDTLIPA